MKKETLIAAIAPVESPTTASAPERKPSMVGLSIGLKDKDLVLYEVIDKAREDAFVGPIVERLEKVFSLLQ